MTGKEIFEKYLNGSEAEDEYLQTLVTISMIYGDDETYKLLEEAEKAGKKLMIIDDNETIDGDIKVVIS